MEGFKDELLSTGFFSRLISKYLIRTDPDVSAVLCAFNMRRHG